MRGTSRALFFLALLTALVFADAENRPCSAQGVVMLRVAVTLPDLAPIVRTLGGEKVSVLEVMPPGSDPHSFTLTPQALASIQSADLIVYGKSDFLQFEKELSNAARNIDRVDWPDYERYGAALKDFPGFSGNPHGFWLGFDNAKAIASGIAEALILKGLDPVQVAQSLRTFLEEVDAMSKSGKELVANLGRERSRWVAMEACVVYQIDNLGLTVADVVYRDAGGFASGADLLAIEDKLREREYAGLVCPLSMRGSKEGEMAEQIARDTGAPVAYVKFLDAQAGDSFLAQAAYNCGAIAVAAMKGEAAAQTRSTGSGWIVWMLVVFGLLIALVMQNKRMYYSGGGGGIFEKKQKK